MELKTTNAGGKCIMDKNHRVTEGINKATAVLNTEIINTMGQLSLVNLNRLNAFAQGLLKNQSNRVTVSKTGGDL
jgi:hypothetical protein